MSERHWVLWAGTVGFESALDLRFEAAAANGYSHTTVSALDISRVAQDGVLADGVRRRAAAAGLSLVVDPIMNWHPAPPPTRRSRFGGFGLDDNLRVIEALGAVACNAVAIETVDRSPAQFVEPFAQLCDRVAELGAHVHLEFIPMTPISDIATAWTIIRDADRANSGVLIDSWHFFRGSASFDDLESVPGDRITSVQLDDALLEPNGEPWEDTKHRLLPGDGEFDLTRLVTTLARKGALRQIGPEVISPELAAMAPSDAARICRDRIEAMLPG